MKQSCPNGLYCGESVACALGTCAEEKFALLLIVRSKSGHRKAYNLCDA